MEPRRLMAATLLAGQGPSVASSPVAVVAADFNGDGKTDLATANAVGGTSTSRISVALGTGDGSFQTLYLNVSVYSNDAPVALAVGDMDSDGRPDLVLAASYGVTSGSVTILQNPGDGKFSSGSTYSIGATPSAVTIADINNDGKTDIVTANRNIQGGNGSVTVLTRSSASAFNSPVTTSLPHSLRDVDVRDMDRDGKVDLVVAADYASIGLGVMRGNGDGTFAAPTAIVSGASYTTVAAGDFNGDGLPDIAGTLATAATATILYANADGTYGDAVTYANGGSAAELLQADLNADGKADLVSADNFAGTISVLLNDGVGGFVSRIIPMGDRTTGVAVADLNDDGYADLAVSHRNSNAVSVLLGTGTGTFFGPVVTRVSGSGAISVNRSVAGDFDQDGAADLIVINTNNGADNSNKSSVAFRHGNGDGTFAEPPATYTIDADPTAPVSGDFNGDGKLDVAVASKTYSMLHVLLGNGDGTFAAPVKTSISSSMALVALDFNNDGNTDLAVMQSNRVMLLRSLGNGKVSAQSLGNSFTPTALVSADFNRDGNADLAVGDGTGVTPLLGNGNGSFTAQAKTSIGTSGPITAMAAGRVGPDEFPDLAVAYSSGSMLGTMSGSAAGTFTYNGASPSVYSPAAMVIADFDGDGLGNIAVADTSAAYVYNGTLLYSPAVLAVGSTITNLIAGDFTGDGRTDLLTTKANAIYVSPAVPRVKPPADVGVSAANGVLTVSAANATLEAASGVPGQFLITTATGQTRWAADGLVQISLSGANAIVKADLGRVAGHAVSLTVYGSATFATSQHLATLNVSGTATVEAGGRHVLQTTGLTILSPRGTLDLNDNALIYDYTGGAPTTTIRNLIAKARAGGTWAGYGLTSTSAKNNASGSTTLGYMRSSELKSIYGNAATFAGEAIDDTALLVQYTTYGDSNFDGKTDFNDFLNLQNAFGQSNKTSFGGDFDYSGTTDFNDFLVLQNNFGASMPVAAPAVKPPPAVATASISGVAFNDANRNGKYDKADSLAAGKTVWLDLDDDGVKDANEPSAVTDAKGRYAFKNLAAGTYHVRRVFPQGYRESTKPLVVSLPAGQAVKNLMLGGRRV